MSVNNTNSLPDVGGLRGYVGGVPVPRMPDDGVCGLPKGMTTHPRHRSDHPRSDRTTSRSVQREITMNERFEIVIEAGPGSTPAITRLRAALKTLLRAYGLRCVQAKQTPAENDARGLTLPIDEVST